jgi:hypothetical protein
MTSDPNEPQDPDKSSARQVLHAVTGDRDAEAKALEDQADDVDEDDAKVAVQRAHGDREPGAAGNGDLATPDDARAARDDHS